MTERDTSNAFRIAVQVSELEAECGRQSFVWQMHQNCGAEYLPPLFRGCDNELPIVPRIAPPRIEGQRR